MNIKLLEQVANAILDEPTKFAMHWWTSETTDSPCGTAACIAGHAVFLQRHLPSLKVLREQSENCDLFVCREASDALDISKIYGAATRLFNTPQWPSDFESEWNRAYLGGSAEDRADIAFWRIQHFIATDGQE